MFEKIIPLAALLLILIPACSENSDPVPLQKPPSIGVFLWDNDYITMNDGIGQPPISGIPQTSNTNPTFIFSEGDIENILLYTVSGNDLRNEIDFLAKNKGDYTEITSASAFQPGLYCFVEGNAVRSFSMHPWWCFSIIGDEVVQAPVEQEVELPSEGLFLISGGNPYQLPEWVNNIPIDSTNFPVVALNSSGISVADLTLVQWIGGTGFTFDNRDDLVVVYRVDPDTGAERGGLKAGDIILAVNGQDVQGNQDLARSMITGSLWEDVDLTVLRGSEKIDLKLTRTQVVEHVQEAFDFTVLDNYLQLVPSYPLNPGVYCYLENARPARDRGFFVADMGWCFGLN